MSNYATTAELRGEYSGNGSDEFSGRLDGELERVIARASGTIDRYLDMAVVSSSVITEVGRNQLKSVCLPIARAYAHDEVVLDDGHPIVREYNEAMGWLARLARGEVSVDIQRAATSVSSIQVRAPAKVFL